MFTDHEKFTIECAFKTKLLKVEEMLGANSAPSTSLNSEKNLYTSILDKLGEM